MLFQINFKSAKPVYLQLVDQVKSAAAAGLLRAGDALPSIRPLSEELRVNRNTVAKAYTQLEAEGIIESQQGRGCFVRVPQSALRKDARRRLLVTGVDEVVVQAHHLQFSRSDLMTLVEERFDALAARQTSYAQKQGTS
ncbi:MAG TPA: GntR family transcriptional regulator [Vicinamibacterales bacterium]|nr:GntR family transcriptional regulator [Vicinamibacterales bacterium]